MLLALALLPSKAQAQIVIAPQPYINASGVLIGPLAAPVGCTTIPYSFVGRTTDGFCSSGNGETSIYLAAVQWYRFQQGALSLGGSTPQIIFNGDAYFRKSAAKTFTLDTDGAGGALTAVNFAATAVTNTGEYQAANFRVNAGGSIYVNGRAVLQSPADGVWILAKNTVLTGAAIDTNTADTVTIKNLANNAAGALSANNLLIPVGGVSSGAGSIAEHVAKNFTNLPDNSATGVMTITVPNSAHSATIKITIRTTLGSGGAIGPGEATGVISYNIAVARTAGVNAVAGISAAYGTATALVAGAATITTTAVVSAVSGAVGVTNTFTINVTVARGSGASTNHSGTIEAEIINANATGITVS